jgi:hypothetical protein
MENPEAMAERLTFAKAMAERLTFAKYGLF